MNRWLVTLLAGLAASLAACGSPQATDTATTLSTTPAVKAWLPTFTADRVDDTPASCRRAVDVELSIAGDTLTGVVLSDKVLEPCEILIAPNKRFYELSALRSECGSRVYYGHLAGAQGPSRVIVTDHGRRECDDLKAGLIEIDEVTTGKGAKRFAGDWQR